MRIYFAKLIMLTFGLFSVNGVCAKYSLDAYDQYVQTKLQDLKVPGMAIAIIENNCVVFKKTYGVKNIESNQAIDENTLFRIASLSKGFTGVLSSVVEKSGYIALDEPTVTYLPKGHEKLAQVQIQHLLSHSSGFYQYACDNEVYKSASTKELHQCFLKQHAICKPGECYQYQNYIFSKIKPVLETATNVSFSELMESMVLLPLNMESTFTTSRDWEKATNKALGHVKDKQQGTYVSFQSPTYYDKIMPAGGMSSTLNDMTRWLGFLINGSKKVLSRNQLKTLFESRIETKEELDRFNSEWRIARLNKAGYGLGWRHYDYAGEEVIAHSGMLRGFTCSLAFLPKYNAGIVILANTETEVPNLLTAYYLDSFLELDTKDWIAIKMERKNKK